VKIIPFAVAAKARDQAVAEAAKAKPVIRVRAVQDPKTGHRVDAAAGASPKVVEKTLKITAARIQPAGATIVAERRVPHEQAALARAIDECAKPAPSSRLYSAPPPSPTGATSFRRRFTRPAARSSISACGRPRQSHADRPPVWGCGDRRARLRAQS